MNVKEEIVNVEAPPLFQPSNFNLQASNVEACRICLATDVKMYSLQGTNLGRCLDSIAGFNESYTGLPNHVCYECAPCLIKCNKLIEKSKTAQATFQDIFAKNGQITKTLIEEQNRSQLNLESPLDSYLLLNYCHIKYDDDNNTSEFIQIKSDTKENINIKLKNEMKNDSSDEETELLTLLAEAKASDGDKGSQMNEAMNSDDDLEEIKQDIPVVEIISDDEQIGDDFISLKSYRVKLDKRAKGLVSHHFDKPLYRVPKTKGIKKNKKRRCIDTLCPLTPDETIMQKYFNIDEIPLPKTKSKKYSCKLCPKTFNNIDDAKDHRFLGCIQQLQSSNSVIPGHNTANESQPRCWLDWTGNN